MTPQPQADDPIMRASDAAVVEAGRYETKIRLIAEVIPELQQHASKGLEELDPIVRNRLNKYLDNPGRKLLALANTLRNSILHGNFKQTRSVLKRAKYPVGQQRIKRVEMPTSGPGMVEALFDAVTKAKDFDPNSEVQGNRFGHHLQAAVDGTFNAAERVLKDCNALLDNALDAYHAEEIAKG
jgi:hypothetical protein